VASYSSSLLSDTNFIWVSGNNINDGRTGILTKNEYLTAGHYFDLRSSFPDLEYRAHDFRVYMDEKREYYGSDDDGVGSDGEVTVRFTTLVTGTFNGGPLRLRSKVMESNGRVMNCPPTSVSITFATDGSEKGKIIKLVTDMVSVNCSSILHILIASLPTLTLLLIPTLTHLGHGQADWQHTRLLRYRWSRRDSGGGT